MPIWASTLETLRDRARVSDSCLVSYLGGKDSLVVMDLCVRAFKRVVGFYMFFVPGLECIEEQIALARQRWGIEVLHYPHIGLLAAKKNGIFGWEGRKLEGIPDAGLRDIYDWVMADTGIPQIATGMKKADSVARRVFFQNITKHKAGEAQSAETMDVFFPIKEWKKYDVLAYCKLQHIPLPETYDTTSAGVGLETPAVLWLHDCYPADYRKLCAWFPFAEAIVWRRKFYGIGKYYSKPPNGSRVQV